MMIKNHVCEMSSKKSNSAIIVSLMHLHLALCYHRVVMMFDFFLAYIIVFSCTETAMTPLNLISRRLSHILKKTNRENCTSERALDRARIKF